MNETPEQYAKRIKRVIQKWRRQDRKPRHGMAGHKRRFDCYGRMLDKNSKTRRKRRMLVGGRR